MSGLGLRAEHAADIKEVIAWVRAQENIPVWLVGTSRSTQSAAYLASKLSGPQGPDGLVLTSTILTDDKGRPVPAMPIDKLQIPVPVVHHEQDGCGHCSFDDLPVLMKKLAALSRTHPGRRLAPHQSRISSARFRLSAASEPTAPDSRYRLT